jgi:hypothetical protein
MKKMRGKRRYYRTLATKNDLTAVIAGFGKEDCWFNHWHDHFDWHGLGDNSFKRRKPHFDCLFRHFEICAQNSHKLRTDFQLFALINDNDSGQDALYIHTPNPYNTTFPIVWENLSGASTLSNKALEGYLSTLEGYERVYGKGEEAFCLLWKNGVGVGVK